MLILKKGMTILVKKLDRGFKSEEIDKAYLTYSKFTNFHESFEMSVADYIIEFEHFYHGMTDY